MTCEIKTDSSTKFTKDILWVGLSQVLIYLFGFLTLPVLTKNFGTEIYGLWAQIWVTVGLLNPILTLHLGTALVRYLSAENKTEKLSQSFSNMFWLILLMVFIAIALGFLLRTSLSVSLFNDSIYNAFIILTFIWAGSGALFAYLIGYLRSKGEIKELSLVNIFCYAFKFIFLVILALLGFSLWFIITVQIIVEIIFIISLFSSITKKIGFKWPNKANLKKYLGFSVPQIPSGALLWIINSSDRYFITGYLGLSQTGIYSASYSIGSIISIFYIPTSFVIFPVISRFWEKDEILSVKRYLEYSTKLFLFFGIPSSVGLYILSKPLLQIFTTSEFLSGGGILTFLIALSTIFLGIYQINLYVICLIEKTKFMPFIIGLSAFINVVINIILIPKIGIMGAAISTVLSYVILALITIILAEKKVNYSFDFVFLSKIGLSSVLMVLIMGILPLNGILNLLIAILIGMIVYLASILILKTFSNDEKKVFYNIISDFKDKFIPIT